jgi:hypothetical protein
MACDLDRCPRCNSHVRVDENGDMRSISPIARHRPSVTRLKENLRNLLGELDDLKVFINKELEEINRKRQEQ